MHYGPDLSGLNASCVYNVQPHNTECTQGHIVIWNAFSPNKPGTLLIVKLQFPWFELFEFSLKRVFHLSLDCFAQCPDAILHKWVFPEEEKSCFPKYRNVLKEIFNTYLIINNVITVIRLSWILLFLRLKCSYTCKHYHEQQKIQIRYNAYHHNSYHHFRSQSPLRCVH